MKLAQLQLGRALFACRAPPAAGVDAANQSHRRDRRLRRRLSWQRDSGAPPTAEATLLLSEGRLEDPRLPQPITELAGRIALDVNHLRIEEMTGKCGMATVAVSLNRTGWAANAPIALAAYGNERRSTTSCTPPLPPVLASQEWDKYQPIGLRQRHAAGSLRRPNVETLRSTGGPACGQARRPAICRSSRISIAYRLTDGSGTIAYFAGRRRPAAAARSDLVAQGGGQPLHIVGQVIDPRPGAAGWVEISGESVEIEPAMIDAMPPKPRDVIATLHPTGKSQRSLAHRSPASRASSRGSRCGST